MQNNISVALLKMAGLKIEEKIYNSGDQSKIPLLRVLDGISELYTALIDPKGASDSAGTRQSVQERLPTLSPSKDTSSFSSEFNSFQCGSGFLNFSYSGDHSFTDSHQGGGISLEPNGEQETAPKSRTLCEIFSDGFHNIWSHILPSAQETTSDSLLDKTGEPQVLSNPTYQTLHFCGSQSGELSNSSPSSELSNSYFLF